MRINIKSTIFACLLPMIALVGCEDSSTSADISSSDSRTVQFEQKEDSVVFKFKGVNDIYSEIESVYWGDKEFLSKIKEKLSLGEAAYAQLEEGVNIEYPLSEEESDHFIEDENFNVMYSDGDSLHIDSLIYRMESNEGTGGIESRYWKYIWEATWRSGTWVWNTSARKWVWRKGSWQWKKVKKWYADTKLVSSVKFGHGARHLREAACKFTIQWWTYGSVERAIKADMKRRAKNGSLSDVPVRGNFPRISYSGDTIEYKPYNRGNGSWNVGTYYCK